MYDRLLVPLDGSELSAQIIPYAVELAKRCSSHVTLVRVVETVGQAMATMTPAEPALVTPQAVENVVEGLQGEQETASAYIKDLANRLAAEGLRVDWAVLAGSPGSAIVSYVEGKHIDVIAMTSHGRTGVERALLGSVADHVMRNAAVPVLVLRYQETKGV